METFCQKLKYLRKNKKISQKDLANYLNISVNSYQRYEYGTREPNLSSIKQIANFFNVSTDFLLGNGVFENWNLILQHKTEIENSISDVMPQIGCILKTTNDITVFIRIISSTIEKIDIDPISNHLNVYYFIVENEQGVQKISQSITEN